MRKLLFGVCFALSVSMFQTTAFAQVNYAKEATEEQNDFEYYEGKVTRGVNVRKGAGADKDKVTVNGKGVSLSAGTIVTIIGTKNVGDKPWYKIKFTYGDQEVTGYATSTYIEKTGVVITPTPIPTPTPEPTPEPTKAPEPTKVIEPSVVPTQVPEKTDTKSTGSNKTVVILVIGLALIGGCCGVFLYEKKKKEEKNRLSSNVSEKVAKLKDSVIGKEEEQLRKKNEKRSANEEKKPEVRVVKGDHVIARRDLIQKTNDVYVKKSEEEMVEARAEFAATKMAEEDGAQEEISMNSAEKKALRLAINNLREHDIIIHKYFGKGEVYDNSDVKLIEVRFGGDARFLNKDQLANKRLIQITNEKSR